MIWAERPNAFRCSDGSHMFGDFHESGWTRGEIPSISFLDLEDIDPALSWSICSSEPNAHVIPHDLSPSIYADCLLPDLGTDSPPSDQQLNEFWEPSTGKTAVRAAAAHSSKLTLSAGTSSTGGSPQACPSGRWRCDKCEKNFSTSKDRELHAIHERCRSYVCEHCNKDFSRRDTLWRHMREHRIEEYACIHCDATFKRRDNLARHTQQQHARTGFA